MELGLQRRVPRERQPWFVHEMVHVWQSGHGSHNILRGIYLWIKYDHITSDYENSYKYDLDSSTSLGYFNMEQQAQIIEDYYRVFKGLPPEKNVGTRKSEADYLPYVVQLKQRGRSAGAADQPSCGQFFGATVIAGEKHKSLQR